MTLTEAGSPYTGSEVTIESGVTVKAQPGTTVQVSKMVVNGTLKAEGTAEKLVVFTSSKLFKGPGDWKNIVFKSGSGASVLEYTEVRYAGTNTDLGAIEIRGGSSPTITHCTIRDNKYYGVKVIEGGGPVISYNTLKSNNSHGISYSAGSTSSGTVNIHDNLVENSLFAGIAVSITGSGVSSTSLGDNELIGNGHEGLSYTGSDIPADVDENTLSKNKFEYEDIRGTVSNSATWEDRGYPIYLSSEVTIGSSATLTLDAGMTVTPYSVAQIVVNGTLNTEGTAESPVRFTSTKASPAAGDWKNIVFNSGSGGVLNYAEVRYGGSGLDMAAIEVKGGVSPTISHSTVSNNKYSGIKVTEGGSAVISYDTLRSNGNYGAYYVAGSTNSGTVNIHDNLAESNSFSGIAAAITGTGVSATSFGNNELIKNGQAGITYTGPDVPPDIDDNTLSENKTNQIEIKGTLVKSGKWKSRGYPFIVSGELVIGPEATLTLEAGFTMKMASTARMVVNGTLNAEGTSENPARVTSNKGSPSPGDWKNIVFNSGSSASVIEYAEVLYGGSNTGIGAIEITGGAGPTIKHSTIANNKFSGVMATEGGSPEIAYNALISNGNYGAYYVAGSKNSGTVNIHDNLAESNSFSGIAVAISGEGATSTSLGDNVLVKNGQAGLTYSGPDIPTDLDENTLSGNAIDKIEVTGTVTKSASWHDRGFSFYLPSEITIGGSGTLALGEGITIQAYSVAQIIVNGTLKTEGTANDPVLFTSSKEAGAGGWKNIIFNSGSGSSVLNHAVIRYAGSGSGRPAIEVNGASPTITHSALRQNTNAAIKVTSGSPTITWNSFTNNGSGLTYTGSGKLSAPHNYWGCASGPSPAGCGNSVSENVEWEPQAEEDSGLGQCRGKESQCGEGADPVSLATGALNYSHRDLRLTNKSRVPLQFVRTYNSADSSDSGLGRGWSQSGLANATELENGDVLVRRQDGRQDIFEKTESGYKAPSGVTDKLSKVEGNFRLTTLQNTVYDFDASGRIAQITDDHGLKTTYGYDGSGLLTTITDPSGQTLTFSYTGSNHIKSVKDSTGREVKYAYSAAGDLESVTDALGGVTKYAYDGQHRMTSITDPKGNVILKNTYDSEGRITEQKDGLENLWKLKYSAGKTVVTEPQGGKLTYGFDSHDRVVSEIDQLGHETSTVYDGAGNVSEAIQPGAAKWTLGHDAAGNLTSVKDPEGGERKYEYDAQNRLTAFTDAAGNAWSYEWSKANDLTKVTDPAKGETTFTYNESGQPLTVTDAAKHKTEFSYDSRGNRLSTSDPLSHKTSFEYNSRNDLTSMTASGLKAEGFERNALGDLLTRTTPEGNKTKYAYDANGMPTQITDPAEGTWKITYNAMERPTAYTDPLEQQTKVAYNGNLKPVKVTNRRGKETTYGYDLANQLTEVSRPEGEDWTFGYDSRGNRTSTIDPRENETTYEYDLLDRMTEANEPLGVSTEYGYDANGDLTSVTDPRANTTSYAYDELGRLTEVAQPLEKTTTYGYDAVGNPLSKATAAGTLEYAYDAANRLTKVGSGESTLRSFGYDAADRLTGATDAESHKIEIGYDNDSRVTSIKDGRGQSLTRSYDSRALLTKQVDGRGPLEYGYDKLGRMTSLTDPQGKALSFAYDPEGGLTEVKRPNGVTTINVYGDAGRLAETTSKDESSTVLEALEYGYDPAGNVVSKLDVRLEQETTFAYDALNRLAEFNPPGEGATAYGYDEAGNRTEAGPTSYEFNALNQLTSASDGTTYSYDGAGRMTGMENEAEETTYEWDLFDHLAKAEGPAGTASYAFDALERLSERKSGESTQVTHYGDLTDLPTYDANGEGETTTSYVSGPHGLIEQRSGEVTSYPLADAHGDVTAISGPTGSVESRQSYDPWGAQLLGPSLEIGYLGTQQRRADPATGLIQMGARSYSPALGSFTTEDPVFGHMGVGVSANRYLYVWDNPLNRYDLDGRDICIGDVCVWGGAKGAGDFVVNEAESYVNNKIEKANEIASEANDAWDLIAPARSWAGDRAQDFWKKHGGPLKSVYEFAGSNWQYCREGARAGAPGGAVVGSFFGPEGTVAGGGIGAGVGCVGTVGVVVVSGL